MTDIASVLPAFSTAEFSHLIPSLDKSAVTVGELIASEPVDIAKKAQLPPKEVKRLTSALLKSLQDDADETSLSEWGKLSLLDPALDEALGGGIPPGYLTEVTGER
jgi:DNA repair protein RAD57